MLLGLRIVGVGLQAAGVEKALVHIFILGYPVIILVMNLPIALKRQGVVRIP